MAERTASGESTNGAPAEALVEEWRNAAYNCFSSGHKFCREVCPVMQVTRDERHTPTAFHANVVAMDEGHLTIEDVAEDYVHCTMCGACELRCPNTLFTGDFYRFRQRTIDVVRAMRTLAVEEGIHQENWQRWAELTDRWGNEPVLGWRTETSGNKVRAWAAGLDLPTGGDTILFADCEAAFYRPSVPRAVALILAAAGVEFGLMSQQWCCGGPMWETGYVDVAHKMAEHNMLDWRKTGTKRIICLDPHDYITIIEHYPTLDENFDEFEILLGVDLVAELIREGKLKLTTPIEKTVTYHDPCRLNKRMGVWQVAARDPAGDPRADVRRRRPRHAVVLLLGRRLEPRDREAGDHRRDQPPPGGEGGGARGRRHARLGVPLVGAPAHGAGQGAGDRGVRHLRARGRVGRIRGLMPLPAMHTGPWPAITRRQSSPSLLPRLPALPASECDLWLGARDPEPRQHYWKEH